MPLIKWSIDDAQLTLHDRGKFGSTLEVPGQPNVPIQGMTLGVLAQVAYGGRSLELRAIRNLDRLRFQLWSEGHLLPRGLIERVQPLGAMCAAHAHATAIALCTRCQRAICAPCSPNGLHCAPCLDAIADDDRRAALRQRRFGVGVSLAIVFALLATAFVTHSPRMMRAAIKCAALVVGLIGYGLWQEHAARKRGLPTAVDPPRA